MFKNTTLGGRNKLFLWLMGILLDFSGQAMPLSKKSSFLQTEVNSKLWSWRRNTILRHYSTRRRSQLDTYKDTKSILDQQQLGSGLEQPFGWGYHYHNHTRVRSCRLIFNKGSIFCLSQSFVILGSSTNIS